MKKLLLLAPAGLLAMPATSLAANDDGGGGWALCSGGWRLIWIGWWHFTGIPC